MNNQITFWDYFLGAIFATYFWWESHFGAKLWKCDKSPCGEHDFRVKDLKEACKHCGKLAPRVGGEDKDGRDYGGSFF